MSQYYCLITGLPDLAMDEGKLSLTVGSFKEELYGALSKADRKVIDLFYLKFDNANLLALLKDKETTRIDPRGNFTAEALKELIARAIDGDKPSKEQPAYMSEFVQYYHEAREKNTSFLPDDALAARYYTYAMTCRNGFTHKWFEFNLNVNNILAALTARKYKLDVPTYIIGETDICEAIRTSGARDFGIGSDLTYYESLQRLSEIENLTEKERKLDLLKWEWLDEATFFHTFGVEKLFAFLVKLEQIERWINLDAEKGKELFRQLISGLKNEVKIPEI